MISREYQSEFNDGVLTLRTATPGVLGTGLFYTVTSLALATTVAYLILDLRAIMTHANFSSGPFLMLSSVLISLLSLYSISRGPWRCVIDARRDRIIINGLQKIKFSTVQHACLGRYPKGTDPRPGGRRALLLETTSGRDIIIRQAVSNGDEDDAALMALVGRINRYLAEKDEPKP